MLFRETGCLLWEPYGAHKYTVWTECGDFLYKNPVRTSQETHYVSATKPNRLMLLGERVAVYFETYKYTMWAECRALVCWSRRYIYFSLCLYGLEIKENSAVECRSLCVDRLAGPTATGRLAKPVRPVATLSLSPIRNACWHFRYGFSPPQGRLSVNCQVCSCLTIPKPSTQD
jgi:hypothetical protein